MAFDKTRFGGVVAPIVNPCGEDDSLDRGALEANLTRLLATDVAGLYINGGTGDAANLTQDERLETAALLVPRLLAAGKLAIVHVGQTNQRQAVELARQAAALGAHAVASIPPKKPWPQIVEYYKALAAAGAPVIVYYIPGVTGMTAGMPELRMLLDIPGVAGIKMSDWNIFLLRSVVLEYPEKVVYSGFDEFFGHNVLSGGDGCVAGLSNFAPEVASAYANAARNDDLEKMAQCQQKIDSLMAIYDVAPQFIPTIKKAMAVRGIQMEPVCAQPLLPATEEETGKIREILKHAGLKE